MAVVNEAAIRGMGALAKNQHEYEESIPMPNLSDLSYYENQARSTGSTLSIGGTTYVNGVLGDDVGEKQHLYLVGTTASPIVISGTVVVRGSVIISGVVSGRGAIYSGDNVYIPKNIQYLNGPATSRPTANDQATVEAWRAANQSKDALGLFAREHVVISDYTNSSWQSYVSGWVNHSLNKSSEDAGIDGIHNTRAGKDGVLGTADDDTLESDGVWTVTRYTSEDAALGLIPVGKSVGDVVPGSGEDIDGDGAYDGTTVMSEFAIPATLSSTNWAGNAPAATTAFSAVSTLNVSRVDAALYTNHTLAALMINSGGYIDFNGSIVSRNESIIYGANGIRMNHDERLTGDGGTVFGFNNPIAWEPLSLSDWEFDRDLGSILADPAQIANYYTP